MSCVRNGIVAMLAPDWEGHPLGLGGETFLRNFWEAWSVEKKQNGHALMLFRRVAYLSSSSVVALAGMQAQSADGVRERLAVFRRQSDTRPVHIHKYKTITKTCLEKANLHHTVPL